MTDLTLWSKNIDLNHFKSDVLSGTVEESQIDFEYNIYGKGGMSCHKEFSHEKWTQWEDIFYK